MKKLSIALAFILIFTSVFSVSANADEGTRTEKFFAEIAETQAITLYDPMKGESVNGLNFKKTSMRIVEDENGEAYSEMCGFLKLGFLDVEVYVNKNGMFMYYPQFNRHMDFSFVWKEQTEDILGEFLGFEENDLIPMPSYPEYMILKSSVTKTDVEGYGNLYVETFTYDIEAVVDDLVSKDIIPDPALYGISLEDNAALSQFYWNYSGDNSGFASSLLYENEATFVFDENGILVAADYFTGEGKEVNSVVFELGNFGGFSAGADAEDFTMPESSANLEVFMIFVKLIFSILVNN